MKVPNVLRTTKIGGGFVKEDVLEYVNALNEEIEELEKELLRKNIPFPSDEIPFKLKTTIFGLGFVKEDALNYFDNLNERIYVLEKMLDKS